MDHIGKMVRQLREERGLNQAQLAVSVGTGPSAISQIENGKRSPNSETLVKLARALEVEVADLFPKAQGSLFTQPPSEEVGEWKGPMPGAFEKLIEAYESVRHRIPHFGEMPPEYRQEVFERVWRLRQQVENNRDGLPKSGAALLHDALSNAALFFIEIYDREQSQPRIDEYVAEPHGRPMPELQPDNENLFSIEDYRERLKVS